MDFKDYYNILEVEEYSSEEEIRTAYRKLARKYHPDVNPNDDKAALRFREINEAHQVLTDPEARAKYNRLTANYRSFQSLETSGDFDWSPWSSGLNVGDSPAAIEGDAAFSDFFYAVFGDMELGKKVAVPNKGQDYHQQLEISLAEAFSGASRILRVGGRRLEVRIPRGAATGTKVRVRGEGGLSPDGTTKGDLYLDVKVTPNPSYQRDGDDLYLDMPVNLYSAVLGGEVIVPTLRGKIKLRIPPETQSGRVFRLKGQGMPNLKNPEQRGDLYAKVMITVPENLSEEEIELFEELADLRGL